ncbi:28S ribosomal protein S18c, mitochondrial-like [Scyliorhinus canicula]|uniref:28S ribosomal protein S18c, mitochondrial-like n=1 Tax=Scyliorhinus canicula TaxID=7830 RepID=UPI0018F60576|nr:28S ribosomal protein S18c, mitochondrial-like [Scyliorhinus canicula]
MTSDTSDMPIKLENPYKEPPKRCILCGISVDYRNTQLLSQFISPYIGHIFGRHITGLCGKRQRVISKAIKRSQKMGFMSVTLKDPAFLKDPNICDFKLREQTSTCDYLWNNAVEFLNYIPRINKVD